MILIHLEKLLCMTAFLLRPWNIQDLDDLVKNANNINVARNMTNQFKHPYTKEAGLAFIEYANKETPINIFAIEIEEHACGGIGIHPKQDIECKNAELGYWLGEPFWGRGIITSAIRQMVEYAFKAWEIERIFARPFGTNIGSQKALEKAGFTLEARFNKTLYKHGEYVDELVYAIRK